MTKQTSPVVLFALLTFFVLPGARAASNGPPAAIVERGPHHRVWQTVSVINRAPGVDEVKTNQYIEIGSGLHRQDGTNWVEADPTIQLDGAEAVASGSAHQVRFPPNIHGNVHITTSDGKHLLSKVLGIAYFDTITSNNVLIAQTKNSMGQLVSSNEVIYRDAFAPTSDGVQFTADVRFVNSKGAFEQDILFRGGRLPAPEAYGLNPATTLIQVISDFTGSPAPESVPSVAGGPGPTNATIVVDEDLKFGETMRLATGKAFGSPTSRLFDSDHKMNRSYPIQKSWQRHHGKNLLIESLAYNDVLNELNRLGLNSGSSSTNVQGTPTRDRQLPSPPQNPASGSITTGTVADSPAVVWDYIAVESGLTNFVFRGDSTYLVSSTVYLYGTSVMEAGSVIKIAPADGNNAYILLVGPLDCQTTQFQPAIITALSDNTVGEQISGSTGQPAQHIAGLVLAAANPVVKHLKIRYGIYGLNCFGGTVINDFRHLQFVHCSYPLNADHVTISAKNILIYDSALAFSGTHYTIRGEHLTIDKCGTLANECCDSSEYDHVYLTNSLLVAVTSTGSVPLTTDHVATAASAETVFHSVGAGQHYLQADSPYRNAGTASIDVNLSKDLKARTTVAPVVLTGPISSDTILAPRAERGGSVPSLGYHYDPIDYAVSVLAVTNATLTLTNGCSIATFGNTTGIWLQDGSHLVSTGSPTNRNHIARYISVQEQSEADWTGNNPPSYSTTINSYNYGTIPSADFRFTDFHGVAGGGIHFYINSSSWALSPLNLTDCTLSINSFSAYGSSQSAVTLKNCLFDRLYTAINGNTSYGLYNNLFRGGNVWFVFAGTNVIVRDNIFDSCTMHQVIGGPAHDHNAYVNSTQLTPTNASDIVLSSLPYERGRLGNFYQLPGSPLIDAGSRTAASAGLFHYTTVYNQIKEAFSTVDIGLHYLTLPPRNEIVWVDDAVPAGATSASDGGDSWTWTTSSPNPYGGSQSQQSSVGSGEHQHYFYSASQGLQINTGDSLFAYVYLDPNNPPSEVMLQWGNDWEHRAYWGDDTISWGGSEGVAHHYMGVLPPVGQWVRLEVPAREVGLEGGTVNGLAFTLYGGRAWWDFAGKVTDAVTDGSINWALNKAATQSSTGWGGDASRVVDGNTSGNWYDNSVSHTYSDNQGYWQVDLATNESIGTISIWNRTDCCSDRINNAYLLVSSDPFSSTDLSTVLSQSGVSAYYIDSINGSRDFSVNRLGRYVRVQLAGNNYLALAEVQVWAPPRLLDTDGDGLPDYMEDKNGNGIIDSGETSYLKRDTDYDSRTDGQELTDGTNPLDRSSSAHVRLAHWKFDDSNWLTEEGYAPLMFNNVQTTTSWTGKGNALRHTSTSNGYLKYRDTELDGHPNINFGNGTLRFWFRPNWSSTTVTGGTGPQTWSRLISCGEWSPDASYGFWCLGLDPTGTSLYFNCHSNGVTGGTGGGTISWTSGQWHQIAMTYSSSGSTIYVDGQAIVTGGAFVWPPLAVRANGLSIGNDMSGNEKAYGDFEEMETFNYPLTATEILANYTAVIGADTDYDGRSDFQELYQDSTSPTDSTSVTQQRLGYWKFNTTTLASENGHLPLEKINVQSIDSFEGKAARMDQDGFSFLKYRDIDNDGLANINLRNGTVRFWYRPVWTSKIRGGSGPETKATLLQLGHFTQDASAGLWAMSISPDGNQLTFLCQSGGSSYLLGPVNIAWAENVWHQIALSYTPSTSSIYIDGQSAATLNGTLVWPDSNIRARGLIIGNDDVGWESARGDFDDLETFNYPLTSADISTAYSTAIKVDSDYDGVGDISESSAGTDPASSGSTPLQRLGYWRFNNSSLTGEQGQAPIYANGPTVATWDGNGYHVTAVGEVATYKEAEDNGNANINCRNGTVRFWFKPDWTTTTSTTTGGPRDWARFVELGTWNPDNSYGWWALYMDPDGSYLSLASITNGASQGIVWCPINWTAGQWHQVAVTYSPTSSAIYIDGQLRNTGSGVSVFPNATVRARGFSIGNEIYGGQPTKGTYDEFETFNYPLSASTISHDFDAVAFRDSDGDGLTDIDEDQRGTDPTKADTDNDGIPDGWEVAHNLNPKLHDSGNDDGSGLNRTFLQDYNDGIDSSQIHFGPPAWTNPNLINVAFWPTATTKQGPAAIGSDGDYWNSFTAPAGISGFLRYASGTGFSPVKISVIPDRTWVPWSYCHLTDPSPPPDPCDSCPEPTPDQWKYWYVYHIFPDYPANCQNCYPRSGAVPGPVSIFADLANGTTINHPDPMYKNLRYGRISSTCYSMSQDEILSWWKPNIRIAFDGLNAGATYEIYGFNTDSKDLPEGGAVGTGSDQMFYRRTVRTADASGNITIRLGWDAKISGFQIQPLVVPTTPVNFQAVAGNRMALLTWSLDNAALGYTISRSTDGINYSVVASIDVHGSRDPQMAAGFGVYRDPRLVNGVAYYYKIKAVNHAGVSPEASAGPVTPNGSAGVGSDGNSAPVLNKIRVLPGATSLTPFNISHSALLAASDAFDADNDPISFRIGMVLSGTLTVNNKTVSENSGLLLPGQSLTWTPGLIPQTADINAFSVRAYDGKTESVTEVIVKISVSAGTVLLSWGNGDSGELGDGVDLSNKHRDDIAFYHWSSLPVLVKNLQNAFAVSAGGAHSIVAASDGFAYSWGAGTYGALGNGSVADSSVPVRVTGVRNVTAIAAGGSHSLALADGKVFAWGWNSSHQLTPRADTDPDPNAFFNVHSVPAEIANLNDVIAVAAGQASSFALLKDGTVQGWGGWYGVNTGDEQSIGQTPTPLVGLTKIKSISAGAHFLLALDQDGVVWGLGDNTYGQLGIEPTQGNTFFSTPQQVNVSSVIEVACGWWSGYALKSDGTVWSWGNNYWGQLGRGTFSSYNAFNPVRQVVATENIRQIAAGPNTAYALRADDVVLSWGDGAWGKLGNGFEERVSVPTPVENLSDIRLVAAGNGGHAFALASLSETVPIGLSIRSGDRQLSLSWKIFPGALRYNVKRLIGGSYVLVGTSPQPNFVETGLANGTSYTYAISAVTVSGETLNSYPSTKTPKPAPAQPQNEVTVSSRRQFTFTWDRDPSADTYYVARLNGGAYEVLANINQGSDCSFTDYDIDLSQAYNYRIWGANESGTGPYIDVIVVPIGGTFAGPTLSVSSDNRDGSATLSWSAVSAATKYVLRISRSSGTGFTISRIFENNPFSPTTTFAISGLIDGEDYYYRVSAVTPDGQSDDSNTITVHTLATGAPSQAPVLTGVGGNNQVYLTWTEIIGNNVEPVEGYDIWRKLQGATTFSHVTSTINTRFFDATAQNGSSYIYKVVPYVVVSDNSGGETYASGEPSNELSVSPQVRPALGAAPQFVFARAGDRRIRLVWDNPGWAKSFSLSRVETDSSGGTLGDFEEIASGVELTYSDSEVINGKYYRYMLTAFDDYMDAQNSAVSAVLNPQPPAQNITSLEATPGNSVVKLAWPAYLDATYYNLESATSLNGPYGFVARIDGNSFRHINLNNGVTYYYRLAPRNDYGDSFDTFSAQATPLASYPPEIPDGLTEFNGRTQIVLSWNASPGAGRYVVARATSFGGQYANLGFVSATTFADTTAAASTTYYYKVKAIAGDLSSNYSEPVAGSLNPNAAVPGSSGNYSDTSIAITMPNPDPQATTVYIVPTNIVISAKVVTSATVERVDFYANEIKIGSVSQLPYTFAWIDAPAGEYQITARAIGFDQSGVAMSKTCPNTAHVQVKWVPEPTYFTMSVADVQIPTPGLPLGVARSYDVRDLATPGFCGYGWKLDFEQISLSMASTLGADWTVVRNKGIYSMSEIAPHLVTVHLPGRTAATFQPDIPVSTGFQNPLNYGDFLSLEMSFIPQGAYMGTLRLDDNDNNLYPQSGSTEPGTDVTIMARGTDVPVGNGSEEYIFSSVNGQEVRFRGSQLESISDRKGNTLYYLGERIAHSSGKAIKLSFSDGYLQAVFDPKFGDAVPVVKYLYAAGNLIEVDRLSTVVDGIPLYEVTKYFYDGTHHLTDIKRVINHADVLVLHNEYEQDSTGQYRLKSQTDGRNITTGLSVDPNAYAVTSTTTVGSQSQVVQQQYDSSGHVISVTNPNSETTAATYDERGRKKQDILLGTAQEPLNIVSTYHYDERDRVVGVTDPNHFTTSTTYNDQDLPASTTDPLGQTSLYDYDEQGNLITAINAANEKTSSTYDAYGNRLTETRYSVAYPSGITTHYSYNDSGTLAQVIDPLNHVTDYLYDENNNRIRQTVHQTSLPDLVTVFTYDGQNRLIDTEDQLHGHSKTIYNELGKQAKSIDRNNRVTEYLYDPNGNLVETIYPGNWAAANIPATPIAITRTVYDEKNRPVYVQERHAPSANADDPYGQSVAMGTHTIYDTAGRVTRVERVLGLNIALDPVGSSGLYSTRFVAVSSTPSYTSTEYDAAGRAKANIDANGNRTEYAYDNGGRRISVTVYNNSTPITSYYGYDANGNQIWFRDANNHQTDYEYDVLNRRIRTIFPSVRTDGLRTEQVTVYDDLGRRVAEIEEHLPGSSTAVVTGFGYDQMGQLQFVTNNFVAGGATSQNNDQNIVTEYRYNDLGQLKEQYDAKGRDHSPPYSTQFAYDELGRRTSRILPGLSAHPETTRYLTISVNGISLEQREVTDFNGKVTKFNYDAAGRLVSKVPDSWFGAPTVLYTYTGTGQRQTMSDASGTTTYTYDLLGRLQTKQTPAGTLNYTYDANGNVLTTSSASGGTSISYTWDTLNRLSTVVNHLASAGAQTTTYHYDPVGNLQDFTYPNSVTHAYLYTAQNRLQQLDVTRNTTPLRQYIYTLGPTGNRTAVAETGRSLAYGYDNLYRLKSEAITVGGTTSSAVYTYDNVGNRLSRNSSISGVPTVTGIGYNDRDLLTSDTYDNNGNTTVSPNVTSSDLYDFENHLIQRGNVQLVYDGDGNRVKKTVTGVGTTYYLIDDRNPTGYSQVLEEINGSGQVARAYVFGHELISQSQSGGISYYGYDGHGSVRLLIDGSGNLTDTYDYDAFGLLLPGGTTSTPNLHGYCGERWDSDLGMYYLRARYMNPGTGRFWTMDSFEGRSEDPLSLHKYLYCRGNPVIFVDPTGHEGELMTAITVVSISLNINSAYHHALNREYGKMTLDLLAAISGGFGLGGGLGFLESALPASLRFAGSAASAGGAVISSANVLKGISIVVAGTDLFPAMWAERHHVLTDKNYISTAPDGAGPFTPQFKELLEGTELKFGDDINIVEVLGHKGPHPEANLYTLNFLRKAISGLTKYTPEYNTAVEKAVQRLGEEAATPGSPLNKMLVKH